MAASKKKKSLPASLERPPGKRQLEHDAEDKLFDTGVLLGASKTDCRAHPLVRSVLDGCEMVVGVCTIVSHMLGRCRSWGIRLLALWSPHILVPLLAPELFEPLLALATHPAAGKVDEQIAVAVAHVVAALHIGIELALWVDADVVPDKLVLEHQMLDGVLLGAVVFLAHQHGVVGHGLEQVSGEGGAAEEGAARVDALVVLGDEDVDVLDAEVLGGVDVGGVLLELAVEDGRVAHEAALDGVRADDLVDEIVVGAHHDDVGVDEPHPLGRGIQVEGLGDGGDLGPRLSGQLSVCAWCDAGAAMSATYPVGGANVVAAGVEPEVCVAVALAVLLAVVQDALQHVGDGAVVAATVAGRQDDDVAGPGLPCVALPAICVVGHLPVPLGLGLEVAGLWLVVVGCHGDDGFGRGVIAVVVDGDVAVEAEEHNEEGDDGDGQDDGSTQAAVSGGSGEGRETAGTRTCAAATAAAASCCSRTWRKSATWPRRRDTLRAKGAGR